MLPAAWRERIASGRHGLPVMITADEIVVFRVESGILSEKSRLPLAGLDDSARIGAVGRLLASEDRQSDGISLLLPDSAFVRREIELPIAAEEALSQVISFELDRHTPFRAAHAVFSARPLGRTREGASIRVDLVVTPRSVIEEGLAVAARLGVKVSAIAPMMDGTAWREHDLRIFDEAAASGVSPNTRLNLALGTLFVVLFAAALLVPILQKRDAAIRLLPRLEAAKAESEKVQAVRNELERLAGDANFILAKKHSTVPATQIVEDLARAFPDTTWVSSFELRPGKQRELVLTGETASATRVIELLEQVGYLKNPNFRSPLSKPPGQTAERFVISAELKSRTLPAMIEASEFGGPPVTNASGNPLTPAPPQGFPSAASPANPGQPASANSAADGKAKS